jgi:hypothetical protein
MFITTEHTIVKIQYAAIIYPTNKSTATIRNVESGEEQRYTPSHIEVL